MTITLIGSAHGDRPDDCRSAARGTVVRGWPLIILSDGLSAGTGGAHARRNTFCARIMLYDDARLLNSVAVKVVGQIFLNKIN